MTSNFLQVGRMTRCGHCSSGVFEGFLDPCPCVCQDKPKKKTIENDDWDIPDMMHRIEALEDWRESVKNQLSQENRRKAGSGVCLRKNMGVMDESKIDPYLNE